MDALENVYVSEKKRRFVFYFGIILLMILCILYAAYNNTCRTITNVGEHSQELNFWIDNNSLNDNCLEISGWVVKKGLPLTAFDVEIICWNEAAQEGYIIPCAFESRPDVTNAMADNVNYDNSGFKATVRNVKDKFRQGTYEIIIKRVIDGISYYGYTEEFVYVLED